MHGEVGGADTPVPTERTGERARDAQPAEARQYIRGSSLLLAGRVISVLLNFVVQVLTVRYLSKGDYGAFAYGTGVASLGASVVLVGLGKALPRLVPIYNERHDHGRAFGAIVLAVGTISLLGLALVVGLYLLQDVVAGGAHVDPAALAALLILIALAPLDGLDNLLQQIAAVFCPARTIFFRRHLLGPGLKLAAILLVIAASGDVYLLAYGYLLGSVTGVSILVLLLVQTWRRQGLLRYLRPANLRFPFREVFGFSLPLLSTDLSVALRTSFMVIMLEYFWTPPAVADYRAVLPVAHLNMVVFEAFSFLFVPLASRMFARNDRQGIGELYWRTSLWIAVLTFPVFAATCLLAPTLTVLFFGERYAQAATILAILAAGHYFNAALGFNAATLRVHGKVGIIVVTDIVTAAAAVALGWVLIQRYGATGAAIATTGTLVLQNVFNHVGLLVGRTGIRLLSWQYARVYVLIGLVSAALGGVEWLLSPPDWVAIVLAAAASLAIVWTTRHSVDTKATFPELLKIPAVRWLLA